MIQRNLTGAAMFLMAILQLIFLSLLFGVCGHYGTWWSLFVFVPILFGICTPNICHSYNTEPEEFMTIATTAERLHACQDFGWSVLAAMALLSWSVPLICWYNEPLVFPWPGAIVTMVAVTAWWMSYSLWLRVFVKKE